MNWGLLMQLSFSRFSPLNQTFGRQQRYLIQKGCVAFKVNTYLYLLIEMSFDWAANFRAKPHYINVRVIKHSFCECKTFSLANIVPMPGHKANHRQRLQQQVCIWKRRQTAETDFMCFYCICSQQHVFSLANFVRFPYTAPSFFKFKLIQRFQHV